jgi:NAD(P)-dependent dehydrogenase (short-subunit alcohol dehydrogenase family)
LNISRCLSEAHTEAGLAGAGRRQALESNLQWLVTEAVVNGLGESAGARSDLVEADLLGAVTETNRDGPPAMHGPSSWWGRGTLSHAMTMREQGSGHIIQISSTGGQVAWPLGGGYHASTFALEGLSDSLAQEVAGFGIKVTVVEPGFYATDGAAGAGRCSRWQTPTTRRCG